MEIEFFIKPDAVAQSAGVPPENADISKPQPSWGWKEWHKHWVEERVKWYESIGLSRDVLDFYWQKPEELAHYAKATVDILYKFPFGTQELEGIAARGDFDLTQHQKFSGKSMAYSGAGYLGSAYNPLEIAADLCIYTNHQRTIEVLE